MIQKLHCNIFMIFSTIFSMSLFSLLSAQQGGENLNQCHLYINTGVKDSLFLRNIRLTKNIVHTTNLAAFRSCLHWTEQILNVKKRSINGFTVTDMKDIQLWTQLKKEYSNRDITLESQQEAIQWMNRYNQSTKRWTPTLKIKNKQPIVEILSKIVKDQLNMSLYFTLSFKQL